MVGFFRLAFSLPVMLFLSWYAVGRETFRIAGRDALLMVMMGAMTALYQVCYFSAVERIGVSVATLLTLCSAPVIVALLSLIIIGEKPTTNVLISLVLALAGTLLLIRPASGGSFYATDLSGHLFALGSAFGYAMVALVSRSLSERYHPFQTIAVSFAFGAMVLFCFVISGNMAAAFTPAGWGLLLYLGLIPTALAYVLFLTGIRHTTATTASICTLIEPLTSTMLAGLIFGERLGPTGIYGALALSGAMGFLYVSRKQRK